MTHARGIRALSSQPSSERSASDDELNDANRSKSSAPRKNLSGLEALTAAVDDAYHQTSQLRFPPYGAASGSPEAKKKRRRSKNAQPEGAVRQCAICGTTDTPKWRCGALRSLHASVHPPPVARTPRSHKCECASTFDASCPPDHFARHPASRYAPRATPAAPV